LAAAALSFGHKCGDVSSDQVYSASQGISQLFEQGRLIRGRNPLDHSLADDPSNDSLCGALCGIYFTSKYGKHDSGSMGIDYIRMLADELINNNYSLIRQDGTPTTYGKLINGWFTDPQRASLCMAVLKTAQVMTGSRKYQDEFMAIYKKHGDLLRFAAFKFLDYTKSHEMHRSAIQLTILADAAYGESNEMIDRCIGGLQRIWKLSRKWRDPWIAALVNRHWKIPESDMHDVILRLHEYPSGGKPPCCETINSEGERRKYLEDHGIKLLKVKKSLFSSEYNWRASQPIPDHLKPTQDFWRQRHPYMVDGFRGEKSTFIRHNAVDFLAPYWLLRMQGLIRAED
jgi:hypothetical protein